VYRENSTLVFKPEQKRATDGRQKPGAVVVSGVVIADGRMNRPTETQVERFFVLKMSKNAGRANPDAGNQEAGELA
jgi:hypothetical protein